MASNPRIGKSTAQLGSLPLGIAGFGGSLTTVASVTVRGTFLTTTAATAVVARNVVKTAAVTSITRNSTLTSAATATVTRYNGKITTQASTLLGARFSASAPVSALVLDNQGPLVVPMTVSIFPEAPITYKGRKPSRSAVGLDSLQLLPVLYNTDPEPVPVLNVSIATVTPPSVATSQAMYLFNPTIAPVVGKLEGVTSSRLGTGTYEIAYTFYRSTGETALSPIALVTLDTPLAQGIQIAALPFPNGITAARIYVKSPGATAFVLSATNLTGGALVLDNIGQTVNTRIDGTLFEIAATDAELPAFSCDLRDFTLRTLAYTIELAGYLSFAYSGWEDMAATIMLDQSYGPVTSANLYGFTSVLWRVIRPLALAFDIWGDDLDESGRQIDVRYASGRWLDWWGVLYGVPRADAEGDLAYRRRITWEVMSPRANNVAMEFILKEALGYDSTISDTSMLARTWYSNKQPTGSAVRDPATGLYLGTVTDPQGAFVGGLTAWDTNSTYNTTTKQWTTGDPSALGWGLSNVGGLVDLGSAYLTWPGSPGRFHVAISQVVEDDQIGVAAIKELINRYKAAGFIFTLSLQNYYRENFDTFNRLKENYNEEWRETYTGPAGMFYTTGTMASRTMSWPPPPAREAYIFEEWSYDGGTIFIPYGSIAVLSRVNDPKHRIRRGLGAKADIRPVGAPGIVPTG